MRHLGARRLSGKQSDGFRHQTIFLDVHHLSLERVAWVVQQAWSFLWEVLARVLVLVLDS
jgi:hypothetical protein